MSFSCSRPFTLTINTPTTALDMPISKAIYAPAPVDKIFGLMGNRVVRFNASTGAREAVSPPFYSPYFNLSDIAYYNGNIYTCVSAAPLDTSVMAGGDYHTWWDIYSLDATTLVPTAMGFTSTWAAYKADCSSSAIYPYGPQKLLIFPGTSILFIWFTGWSDIFWIDLATPANKGQIAAFQGGDEGWTEFCWVPGYSTSGGLFQTDTEGGPEIDVYFPPFGVLDYEYLTLPWAVSGDPLPRGICSVDSSHLVYVVSGQRTVWKIDPTAGALSILYTFTLPVGAKPIVARYNSVDGLIYCPNGNTNEIFTITPVVDFVNTVPVTFDNPVDVVFTPTMKWAVQWGSTPLVAIP